MTELVHLQDGNLVFFSYLAVNKQITEKTQDFFFLTAEHLAS